MSSLTKLREKIIDKEFEAVGIAILELYVYAGFADGELSEEESDILLKTLELYTENDLFFMDNSNFIKAVDNICVAMNNNDIENELIKCTDIVNELDINNDVRFSVEVLKIVLLIIAADGKIEEAEGEYADFLQNQFNISDEEFDSIVDELFENDE